MVKNKLLRDTVLLTVMQLALDSAALLLNSFITRQLGASAVGLFSLMGSFLGLAGILSNGNAFLCTSRLISEELGKTQGNPNRVLLHGISLCMMTSASVSIVIFIFAQPIGSAFFGSDEMTSYLRLMPIALISGAVCGCIEGYYNACRKASLAAVSDIVNFIVKAAVIVAMTLSASHHDSASACKIMITAVIAGNAASLLLMILLFPSVHVKSAGRSSLSFRDYAALAFPIMGGSILTSFLSSANDALVPVCLRQFGDSQEKALALFGIFEAIVIPTVFFPSVVLCSLSGMIVTESARASAAGNRERLKSLTQRIIRYTLIYAAASSAVLIRFGRPLGVLLGGGETGGKMIAAIAPVVPFIYLEIVLEALIKGMGLQGFSSLNYLAEYVIRISIVLILVPRCGFVGIAISYYASNIFGNVNRLTKLLRHTSAPLRPLKTLLLPALYCILTMSAAELLCKLMRLDDSSVFGMIFFIIIWLGGYIGIFLFLEGVFDGKRSGKIVQNAQKSIL